jgi:hypothetical protein
VIFGAFSWRFSCGGFEAFLLGIWLAMHSCALRHSFLVIPLKNPWEKMLDFGVFLGFWKVVFLVEILRFFLI